VTWDSSINDLAVTWRDTDVASLKVLYWHLLEDSSLENLIDDWLFGLRIEAKTSEGGSRRVNRSTWPRRIKSNAVAFEHCPVRILSVSLFCV
jgi:hypothetical protein